MPAPQPRLELDAATIAALAGKLDPHGNFPHLSTYICLVCNNHTFGDCGMVSAPCQHVFHKECIEDALARDGAACPCRSPVNPGQATVVDMHRSHKQMMNSVPVQCTLCREVMEFERLRGHLHEADGCPNALYRCGYEGCGELFRRSDKEGHLTTCPHRIVSCDRCDGEVKHIQLQEHKADECPHRMVGCTHCKQSYPVSEQGVHMRDCSGAALMKHVTELREQMGEMRGLIEQQRQTIIELKEEVDAQKDQIAQLQRSNDGAEKKQGNERPDAKQEDAAGVFPRKLLVHGTSKGYDGEYDLTDLSLNGAPVWSFHSCYIFRGPAGHWGLTNGQQYMQQDIAHFYNRNARGNPTPLSDGGWEFKAITKMDSPRPGEPYDVRITAL
eukprot:TRINITY_DN1805_c3_g1_i1.p1 TRINITY_DN1805_c3_g1~~TRINITY_DN1805_c3_g1_i1.p1  ORF type:complete len:412 (+),score=132.66 TRINITY_DN1805_c3_g1_i1:84-1238(+)